MAKRFVYAKLYWGSKKGLQIQHECEDGRIWFGIEEAIQNYLEETGLKIENVEWLVWSEANNEYISIKANDVADWKVQFEQIEVVWEKWD